MNLPLLMCATAGEAMQIDPSVPGFTAMNVALVLLQALHVRVFHAAAQQTAARLCFAHVVSRSRYTVVQIFAPILAAASIRGSV